MFFPHHWKGFPRTHDTEDAAKGTSWSRGVHVGQGQGGGRLRWVAGPFAVQTEMAIAKWLCYALWTDMNRGRIWELGPPIIFFFFFGGGRGTYGYLIFTQNPPEHVVVFFPEHVGHPNTLWTVTNRLWPVHGLAPWFGSSKFYEHEYLLIFDRCVFFQTQSVHVIYLIRWFNWATVKTPAIPNMYSTDIGLWKLMEIVKSTR